jgi:hypothetical protein
MRSYLFIIAALPVLASCEKEVQVDLPKHQSALVLNSYTETDGLIQLQVGKSLSIKEYNYRSDLTVTNATVQLYKDGQLAETMQYDAGEQQYLSAQKAIDGSTYEVKVSAPGFTRVEATSIVPSKVPIEGEVLRTQYAKTDAYGTRLDELRIRFTDPPGAGDHYILKFYDARSQDTTAGFYYYADICLTSPDASVETAYNDDIDQNTCLSSNGIFMKDELFNGTTKDLRLYLAHDALDTVMLNGLVLRPYIELYHVPEAYYRYIKTYQYAQNNNGNPFSEPINVFSSVKNGYGIFSITSLDSKQIK